MEFIAWSNHKYIMHGFLWQWHKDHHHNDSYNHTTDHFKAKHGFEKNDLFFLIYAVPAFVLIFAGLYFHLIKLIFIGIGISLYGITYFIIHDVFIHQRIRVPFLIKNQPAYLKALLKAHYAHHQPNDRQDFNNFGLLIFPLRFFKK